LFESLDIRTSGGRSTDQQHADPRNLPFWLSLGARRDKQAKGKNQQDTL
jgi:hypothetical protein